MQLSKPARQACPHEREKKDEGCLEERVRVTCNKLRICIVLFYVGSINNYKLKGGSILASLSLSKNRRPLTALEKSAPLSAPHS